MEDAINRIAGVVTVGLFAHRGADVLHRRRGRAAIETIISQRSGALDLQAGADLDDPVRAANRNSRR